MSDDDDSYNVAHHVKNQMVGEMFESIASVELAIERVSPWKLLHRLQGIHEFRMEWQITR